MPVLSQVRHEKETDDKKCLGILTQGPTDHPASNTIAAFLFVEDKSKPYKQVHFQP